MRWAVVVIALAAIGTALVHLRRDEARYHHEIRRLGRREIELRRQLQSQQVRLAELTNPRTVKQRVVDGSLGLVDRTDPDAQTSEAVALAGRVSR